MAEKKFAPSRHARTPVKFPSGCELFPTVAAVDAPGGEMCAKLRASAGMRLASCLVEVPFMHQTLAENLDDRIHLIRSEFAEMPGLHLSKRQAQRLWNLDPSSADVIFDALEAAHFLRRTPQDMYVRAAVGC